MIEDKLTHDERRRLEALAQANSSRMLGSDEEILERAAHFEQFIRGPEVA